MYVQIHNVLSLMHADHYVQVVKRCQDAKIESVYDIMEMEDDQRSEILRMDARQM